MDKMDHLIAKKNKNNKDSQKGHPKKRTKIIKTAKRGIQKKD
jgi:hypothetical protein